MAKEIMLNYSHEFQCSGGIRGTRINSINKIGNFSAAEDDTVFNIYFGI